MSKKSRIVLKTGAGVLAGTALLLLISLTNVDHRPYFTQGYFKETKSRLARLIATNSVTHGELEAGFGAAVLTPKLNAPSDNPSSGEFRSLPLAGYGDRDGRPATGVHDELFVKAVALRVQGRVGVFVAADALIIPPEVTETAASRVKNELHLTRDQIYLSATHTHASIGGWGEGFLAEAFAGGFQPGTRTWFADRIVTAVREALEDLQPASIGHGYFAAASLVRNRLVGESGRVDPEFSFTVVQQASGRLSILGSYAAHATVLPAAQMEFSGDYPGAWQRSVEQATSGVALFLAGAVGSHAPVAGEKGFAGIHRMGAELGKRLVSSLPSVTLTNQVTFGMSSVEVSLPPSNVRISDGLRLRPWLAQPLLRTPPVASLQVFRLNGVLWISTPCDFSGELALDLKDFTKARGMRAVITSFNGSYVGYVIPARYYHLDSYESRVMSFFGPHVPDYFCELIREMSLSLMNR